MTEPLDFDDLVKTRTAGTDTDRRFTLAEALVTVVLLLIAVVRMAFGFLQYLSIIRKRDLGDFQAGELLGRACSPVGAALLLVGGAMFIRWRVGHSGDRLRAARLWYLWLLWLGVFSCVGSVFAPDPGSTP